MSMKDDDGTLTLAMAVSTIWIPANQFLASAAGPALEIVDAIHHGWLLDGTSSEVVSCAFIAPPKWNAVDITYYGYNATADAGAVVLGYYLEDLADGSSLTTETPTIVADATFTAGAEDTLDIITGDTDVAVLAGGYNALKVGRLPGDAGDNKTGDWGLLGVSLRRAA